MGGFYFILAIILFVFVFLKDRGITTEQKLRTLEYKKANANDAGTVATREHVPDEEILEKYLEGWLRNGSSPSVHPSFDKYLSTRIRRNILYAYENNLGYVMCDVSKDKNAYGIYTRCIFELFYLIMCKEANKNPYKGYYRYNIQSQRDEYVSVNSLIKETAKSVRLKYYVKGIVNED